MSFNIYASRPTLPKAPYVSPQIVKQWQKEKENIVFVDVREPPEYLAGHLDGAINIPYREVEGRVNEFKKANEPRYIFYCIASSWRAPYSANTLADLGFTNIYVLEGGIAAWNAGGQVIYASPSSQPASVALYPAGLERVLNHPADKTHDGQLKLTAEELSFYDGKDGRPAYAAVSGVIYDFTQSRLWRGGEHDPSHGQAVAGRDLTDVLKDSPHGDKHLRDFPVVGYLVDKNF